LSPAEYEAFKYNEPELRHEAEARSGEVTKDKAERLIRLALMPVLWNDIDRLPQTGWGTLRELSKLNEDALRCLFPHGSIGPYSTRENIDALRSAQKSKNVAPRHPEDWSPETPT
jgi:hypothetical protein